MTSRRAASSGGFGAASAVAAKSGSDGPNPEVGCWYVAALPAAAEMAAYLGQADFAQRCADLSRRGAAWMDANLFNGRWYEQQIRPPANAGDIARGLRHHDMGARDVVNPDLQIGPGCLADQLVGAVIAEMSGLGPPLDRGHTERTILAYNRVDGVSAHLNPMRAYMLGEERGLLFCRYPDGDRPDNPFPYSQEVWTGLEYTAAAGVAQGGRFDDGSAGARWSFSPGNAWGTAVQRHLADALEVTVEVHEGAMRLDSVELAGLGECARPDSAMVRAGDSASLRGRRERAPGQPE